MSASFRAVDGMIRVEIDGDVEWLVWDFDLQRYVRLEYAIIRSSLLGSDRGTDPESVHNDAIKGDATR